MAVAQDATPAPATEPAEPAPQVAAELSATEVPSTEIATEPATQVATETAIAVETPPILPNTDWIVAGSAIDPAALDPGAEQWFAFDYFVTTHRTGTAIHAELRHADGSIASGWGLDTQAGEGEWAGGDGVVDVTEWGTLIPDSAFTLSLIVTAPAGVTAEQTVSLWISSTASTERGEVETGVVAIDPIASLTVVPPAPTADDLDLGCDPAELVAQPGSAVTVTCTVTSIVETAVTITAIDIASPAGWAISSEGGTATDAGLAIAPGAVVSASQPYTFTVTLAPSCDASTASQSIDVTTIFAYGGVASAGPSTTISVQPDLTAASEPPNVVAEPLDFGALQWDGDHYPSVDREITLTIPASDSVCPNAAGSWLVLVQYAGMTGPGGETLPASSVAFTGVTGTSPDDVTSSEGPLPLDPAGVTIASISTTSDIERSWSVTFRLAPPDDTSPGAYAAPITFEVVPAES